MKEQLGSYGNRRAEINRGKCYYLTEVKACHKEATEMAYRVKSFGMEIRPFKTMKELELLDELVNNYVTESGVKRIISVSDAAITDDKGETIGLVRVLGYED
jgi:hypothetical protein